MPYANTRLGRWFYEERGAPRRAGAPAIVLGHSYLCDGGMWKGQMEALASLGRVINFDLPGHGKSEVPQPFTLEEQVDALLDACGELGVETMAMVGLSWGGMLAMRMALLRPERLAAMVLLDTNAGVDSLFLRMKYRAMLEMERAIGMPKPLLRRQVVPVMFGPRTIAERPDLIDDFERRVLGYAALGLYRSGRAVMTDRTDISERIGEIRVPTLVVCGRDDRATKPPCSELMAARIPGAELRWVSSGHISALETPDEVTSVLTEFLPKVL